MGRAPCCDKANVKKGPWSPEEDAKLKSYMDQHGTGGNWIALPQKIGLKRCGKSCRLRWLNYLRPNIKHGGFSEEEDNIICSLYITIGSRWSIIAAQLPGRTDNDIKNYWNTRLKKKLLGKQRKGKQAQKGREPATARGNQNSSANTVPNYSLICPHPAAARGLQPQPPVLPPIPYSNEEPRFNEHGSIRKLLIKFGGRFSDENQIDGEQFKLQCPVISEPLIQPAYCNSMDLISNSAQIPSLHATPAASSSVPNGADLSSMLPGASVDWSNEAMECLVYENPQKLQGLEFLYDDVINNTINGTAESMDWGEMSSLVFAPSASHNNEGFLHAPATTPPEEELVAESMMRYPGTH